MIQIYEIKRCEVVVKTKFKQQNDSKLHPQTSI